MEKFKQVKTGLVGSLKEQNPNNVTLILETGEEKVYSTSTFKRWWRLILDDDIVTPADTVETVEVAEIPNIDEPQELEPLMEDKDAEVIANEVIETTPIGYKLRDYTMRQSEDKGCELYHNENERFVTLKQNGQRCMAFTYNKKGIDLWLYSDLCDGKIEYRPMKRKLNAGVRITEYDLEHKILINQFIEASIARLTKN